MPQKYARDHNTGSTDIAHFQWGSLQTVAATVTANRIQRALEGHLVFMEADTTCHFRLGDDAVVATTSDPLLKAGRVYRVPRARGELFASVVTAAGHPDGTVEIWEADSFEAD